MPMRIWNTLTEAKDSLPDQKKIRLFVCGPTVYDYAHIGHARTYIFFDFFAKYLRLQGYEVFYLQNITDVDDKIIKRAEEEKKDPAEVAKFYTVAYYGDMEALGVDAVTKYAPATDFISQIVAQVQRLIDKGYAYEIKDDGWYFDLAKFSEYGALSHRTAEQAEDSISRIDEAVGKRNKGDFCLWKFSKPGEPVWPAEIGAGRPGWHIEDTAISEYYFGPQYDIHGGGVDLKFPHHEAEIAQQESASGKKPFVAHWVHTGTLLVDGKKMSKSLGNFITIREFLKAHDFGTLRLLVLKHHYRSPMDYTEALAEEARQNLLSIAAFVKKLDVVAGDVLGEKAAMPKEFVEALEDDLNTPKMFAALFAFVTARQKNVWSMQPAEASRTAQEVRQAFELLSIPLPDPEIPANVRQLANKREESRASKQFEQSDRLRKEINDLGYEIEDTPRGPFLWPKY